MGAGANDFVAAAANALQSVCQKIDGIQLSPRWEEYPGSITAAHLPMTAVWPDRHEVLPRSMDYAQNESTFVIECYVAPTASVTAHTRARVSTMFAQLYKTLVDLYNQESDYMLDYGETTGFRVFVNYAEPIQGVAVVGDLFYSNPETEQFTGFQITVPLIVNWGADDC